MGASAAAQRSAAAAGAGAAGATGVRFIHPELRPEEVASKAMRRKIAARRRADTGALAAAAEAPQAEVEAASAGAAAGGGTGVFAWLGANVLSGFAMALGFSAVALLARAIVGAAGTGTGADDAWLRAAESAAAAQAAAADAPASTTSESRAEGSSC